MPSMSTEAKRMGYIMNPPFSKVESSFHDSAVSAAKAEEASAGNNPANRLNSAILIARFIVTIIGMRFPIQKMKILLKL